MTQSKVPGPNLGSVTITGTVTEQQAQSANVATTWTSATSVNTTTATYAATNFGTANVGIRVPTTTTAGAITIEVSQDGTDWVPAGAVRQDNTYPENPVPLAYLVGTNGTRVYAFSIDAFTLIRVRLSTVIVGAGNVVVTISAVAGGIEPLVATRARKAASYVAMFRGTTRSYSLLNTFAANSRKQFATIHHAAASTRTVRIQCVQVMILSNSVASDITIDLVKITTAPTTGNPAITPAVVAGADAAAEATCLALPGTAATEASSIMGTGRYWLGITPGTPPATYPPPQVPWVDLFRMSGDDAKALEIRAGVLEGWAVTVDSTGASQIGAIARVEFTEEAP